MTAVGVLLFVAVAWNFIDEVLICTLVDVSVVVTYTCIGLLRTCWILVAMSVIIAMYVDPSAIAFSSST